MDEGTRTEDFPGYNAFRERVFERCAELVDWATVPMTFSKDRVSTLDRSGVLLQIGEQIFLITAQHQLSDILNAGYLPFVATQRAGEPEIPLAFQNLMMSKGGEVDTAFFLVHPGVVERLRIDYRFLRLSDVRIGRTVPGDSFYLVMGYPRAGICRDEENRQCAAPFRFLTIPFQGIVPDTKVIDPTVNCLLNYSKDGLSDDGSRGLPPNPKGCSGCGVWHAAHVSEVSTWQGADLKLAGIQTAWDRRHRFLQFTWIDHALAMIWRTYSDTRAPMRLVGIEF